MRRVQALGQNEHTQYCFLPPPLPITAQQPHPGVPITRGTSCPGVPAATRSPLWVAAVQELLGMVFVWQLSTFPVGATAEELAVPWIFSWFAGALAACKKGMQCLVPAGA